MALTFHELLQTYQNGWDLDQTPSYCFPWFGSAEVSEAFRIVPGATTQICNLLPPDEATLTFSIWALDILPSNTPTISVMLSDSASTFTTTDGGFTIELVEYQSVASLFGLLQDSVIIASQTGDIVLANSNNANAAG